MDKGFWTLNEREYFEAPGISLLVFHNQPYSRRQSGLEIIQHGQRVATNGGLRLAGRHQCEAARTVDRGRGLAVVSLRYPESGVEGTLRIAPEGKSLRIVLDLARPLPSALEGRASFELLLFPAAYFGRTYHLGERVAIVPRQGNGTRLRAADGTVRRVPLARGPRLSIAPEDPLRQLTIEAVQGELTLTDPRDSEQEEWLRVETTVPAGATAGAVHWLVTPNSVESWRHAPVIGVSQAGYHPEEEKRAVIEVDRRQEELGTASLHRIEADGSETEVAAGPVAAWGDWLRYRYGIFDFTPVRDPGAYFLRCADRRSRPFRIGRDVYQDGVWQPALESYFPVQMCHMEVRDGEQVWHGACHLDDAMQAPPSFEYADGYRQGPVTDTPYRPDEHIPHLDRGGWHDAGDDDLRANAQAEAVLGLALAEETFGVDLDQTTVDRAKRLVLLHQPDGVPDVIQQIAHGAENLLSGYRAAGHSFSGIITYPVEAYHQVGDWALQTDNLIHDPSLAPDEVVGNRTGRKRDRYAFTGRDTGAQYLVATALAAASRVLQGCEQALAEECLTAAVETWEFEQTHEPVILRTTGSARHPAAHEVMATAELLITTSEARYTERLASLLPAVQEELSLCAWSVARALPLMVSERFAAAFREAMQAYSTSLRAELESNPYYIRWQGHSWGPGGEMPWFAMQHYFLHQTYPELFGRDIVLAAVHYLFGRHPGSDVSIVSGVGAHSLTTTFGINRNHWYYIPGALASGTSLIHPDFPELKEDFPFLWQQSENCIRFSAAYVFAVLAADELAGEPPRQG
jgi:endoglucanase